jgi:Ca2+ transporting ATPase
MTLYIVLVLVILMFFGELMWDIPYTKATPFFDGDVPTNKAIHYTIIFNSFVFMTLFNEINCRMVGAK